MIGGQRDVAVVLFPIMSPNTTLAPAGNLGVCLHSSFSHHHQSRPFQPLKHVLKINVLYHCPGPNVIVS